MEGRGQSHAGIGALGEKAQGKLAMSPAVESRRLRLMMVCASVFIGAWGVLHFLIPALGNFGEQLQGVPDFTVDLILFTNFMTSLTLVAFGTLGVLVATRLWADATAVRLIGYPTGLMCLAYSGYMIIRPWQVPFPMPSVVYVIGPALLAMCFLIPAFRR